MTIPTVSIGLPVYNGEQFIEAALVSLLNQTFEDFELIISDNASSDRTGEICRSYASKDKRIKYFRNDTNLGAAFNFNRVFELASGEYFKWAAHDDVYADTFLEKCVLVLEQHHSVVLCFTKVRFINEDGVIIDDRGYRPRGLSPKPHERFLDLVGANHIVTEIFGLIRARHLKQTPLIGSYGASDRVLLGELALHGRFYEIPDYVFFHREHRERSARVCVTLHSYMKWLDPTRTDRLIFPTWRILGELLRSIYRAPLNWDERRRCYLGMVRWLISRRWSLVGDLGIALKQILSGVPRLIFGQA